MAFTEAQQQAGERGHRGVQDKKFPYLIRITDGSLFPNVPRLKRHKDMRVYTGDPKLSTELRLKYLDASVATARPAVVNSRAEADDVDVGKMSRAELVAFAAQEYAYALDEGMSLKDMRAKIVELANTDPAPDDLS